MRSLSGYWRHVCSLLDPELSCAPGVANARFANPEHSSSCRFSRAGALYGIAESASSAEVREHPPLPGTPANEQLQETAEPGYRHLVLHSSRRTGTDSGSTAA